MKNSVKVFLSCFLGALIGGAIGLQFTSVLAFVGVLAGGAIGYFSYQFEDIVSAIPKAWERATACKPDFDVVKQFCRMVFATSLLLSHAVYLMVGLLLMIPDSDQSHSDANVLIVAIPVLLGMILVAALFVASTYPWKTYMQAERDNRNKLGEMINTIVAISYKCSPVGIIYLCIKFLFVSAIPWCYNSHPLRRAGLILNGVKVFGWSLFKQIHSSERLVCMTDAAIGAAVGLYFGSPIAGAVVGGLLGVLNYELVSKRWLKLLPTEVTNK